MKTREFLIDKSKEAGVTPGDDDLAARARRRELEYLKLRRMVAYADSSQCLRATILRYFGDPAARDSCGACSNCVPDHAIDDAQLDVVRTILRGHPRRGRAVRPAQDPIDVDGLRNPALPDALRQASSFGALSRLDWDVVDDWISALVAAKLVGESADKYRTFSLTPAGREVVAGHTGHVRLIAPLSARSTRHGSEYGAFRRWRRVRRPC